MKHSGAVSGVCFQLWVGKWLAAVTGIFVSEGFRVLLGFVT